ncbi:DUF6268 family outer membrane beta-barrel protein [Halioglobus pacificus]|uniref:DUF6268 domain-containing protein n=1 Tax=Parahalioglobus pacificus TaxID=930806 RepID=A0A918XD22_9GAMM|nr:DUF6268 family outer membrane beta-barrel protein [Halioglobus pacificus]GHD25451.1 hypothetical protein GCM10007053_01240 [Halioglobus pacificus]
MNASRELPGLTHILCCWTLLSAPAEAESFFATTASAFKSSNIEFQRTKTNAPFLPLAFADSTHYGDVEVTTETGENIEYDVHQFSAMGVLPILLGENDALFGGLYASQSAFDFADDAADDFDVLSVGVPIGWLHQTSENWQAAAFLMPLGHKADSDNADWSWQYLGGAFARYIQSDELWWAFGAYMDVGSGDDLFLPYLGASWAINEAWTLSAIMPWPALIYSPSKQWMMRLGAAPSGASWALDTSDDTVSLDIDAWDFGLGVEYRFAGDFWVSAEVGVSGLRGLSYTDGSLEQPDLEFSSNSYVSFSVKFRPSGANTGR